VFQDIDVDNIPNFNYFQIKKKTVDGRTTLQFLDISADIFYNELKAQDLYIKMSNSTLSHEVRNPLNSIITNSLIQE
jgi:hypothetical protein